MNLIQVIGVASVATFNFVRRNTAKALAAAAIVTTSLNAGIVQAQVTPLVLPDTGVDLQAYVDAYAAELGPGVKAAMLLCGAFLVLRVFIKWVRRAA